MYASPFHNRYIQPMAQQMRVQEVADNGAQDFGFGGMSMGGRAHNPAFVPPGLQTGGGGQMQPQFPMQTGGGLPPMPQSQLGTGGPGQMQQIPQLATGGLGQMFRQGMQTGGGMQMDQRPTFGMPVAMPQMPGLARMFFGMGRR